MSINFGFWGVLFGWILMPRWWKAKSHAFFPALSYFLSLVIAVFIVRYGSFDYQAKMFLLGMVTQFVFFSFGGWILKSFRKAKSQ